MTYLFIKCVTKSCDLHIWLINFYANQRHHVSLECFTSMTGPCEVVFKKVFNVENIIILSLNTIMHIML